VALIGGAAGYFVAPGLIGPLVGSLVTVVIFLVVLFTVK
jgi:hypothetical protein